MRFEESGGLGVKKIASIVVAVLMLLFAAVLFTKMAENVNADEIMVVQDPIDGDLHWYTSAGVKYQGFGSTTTYKKRDFYKFEAPAQFNDGGKGTIHGSLQYDMPLDSKNLTELHTRFGNPEAIKSQVIQTVTNKVIYMTGPTMSSRESYAEKRNYLINYVQDQIDNGVYRTRQAQVDVIDQLSGQKKVATIAEIVMGADGHPARQEASVVGEFGIRAFNFAIEQIDYDETVEQQIKDQQKIAMDVQTSIADSLKAQQQAITVEQQGKADAAKAKWEQEVIKAKEVTAAEQRLRVAELDRQSAEQTKQKEILLGEGESRRRELVMSADGALEKKLDAYLKATGLWAEAVKGYSGQWVPQIVMGQGGGQSVAGGGAQQMMDIVTTKMLRDLGLDMKIDNKR